MSKYTKFHTIGLVLAALSWPVLACGFGQTTATAIPAARPADFEVQTATPTTDPRRVTPTVDQAQAAVILPLSDAPTFTPDPNALPTPPPEPATVEPTLTLTPTLEVTITTTAPPVKKKPVLPPDPPLQGGDWDFEADFIPWPNPHGDPCPGARVAAGWTAFVEKGPYGSSCMNENLYKPNVFSGAKSQEMTFDFISANSGVWRTIPTQVGHRYKITAYAKHDHSLSPVEMALGVDLTGDTAWSAPTVQWFPWDNGAEDTWSPTEEIITATGGQMTIFIKGRHPMAEQGGKTVIDNVSVVDLGE
jgi:hypothetical protein